MVEFIKKNREIVLYLIFGFGTTCVNWLSYSFSVAILGNGIIISNIISWVLATVFSFITNKYWVFNSMNWNYNLVAKELAKFVSARLATGVFEFVMVPFLVHLGLNQDFWGIEGIVSKILVSVFVVIVNYFFSKWLIFKK